MLLLLLMTVAVVTALIMVVLEQYELIAIRFFAFGSIVHKESRLRTEQQ